MQDQVGIINTETQQIESIIEIEMQNNQDMNCMDYQDQMMCDMADGCEWMMGMCMETSDEDCNGICAPESWVGDGFCDDGSYEYNENQIFFNCDEFNNDEGDCDVLGRTTTRPYPNNKLPIQ